MSGVNLGDLPSWIMVVLIGIGLWWANSNGVLSGSYELGNLLVYCGLGLGAFYFLTDISNKL